MTLFLLSSPLELPGNGSRLDLFVYNPTIAFIPGSSPQRSYSEEAITRRDFCPLRGRRITPDSRDRCFDSFSRVGPEQNWPFSQTPRMSLLSKAHTVLRSIPSVKIAGNAGSNQRSHAVLRRKVNLILNRTILVLIMQEYKRRHLTNASTSPQPSLL
ncbi:hypothetical protein L218DRAFT_953249 [Marasmius fiardii PR-910]|nr:hypothetical protein L218DRAFT_953249 [Marasmius fiardii PR-910]